MAVVLVRNWWALALRGALAVLFGVAAFVMPGLTLVVLIALFGAYALIDGVLAIVAGVKAAEHHERFGSLLWRGVLDRLDVEGPTLLADVHARPRSPESPTADECTARAGA